MRLAERRPIFDVNPVKTRVIRVHLIRINGSVGKRDEGRFMIDTRIDVFALNESLFRR